MRIFTLALCPIESEQFLNISRSLLHLGNRISALSRPFILLITLIKYLIISLLHLLSVPSVLILDGVERFLFNHLLLSWDLLWLSQLLLQGLASFFFLGEVLDALVTVQKRFHCFILNLLQELVVVGWGSGAVGKCLPVVLVVVADVLTFHWDLALVFQDQGRRLAIRKV